MTVQTECPGPDRLQNLIENRLSDADQFDLVRHLDDCDNCQQAMQNLANGGRPWSDPMRHLDGDRPASDSAFWPTVAQLKRAVPPPLPTEAPTVPAPGAPSLSGEVLLDFLTPPEEPGTLGRLERFHVLRVVGRGGMGLVLEALDECLQRKVAIKVMDPQMARDEVARKRFCREARAAAAVVHENVVTIHQVDSAEAHDLPYLVMQYVAGESLQELLDRVGPLPVPDIIRMGRQIALGLAAAHAQGLIHRDIKPANVLLQEEAATKTTQRLRAFRGDVTPKITDFGLARSDVDMRLTQTGFVAGTPLYMAPEQARGEELDHRTDLFSFGGVLYAMCTGQPPFEASTPYLVLRRVTDEQPRPIEEINPDIPDWLLGLIDRLLAKEPADRIQSAAEVAEIFAQHVCKLQMQTPESPTTGNLARRSGRTPAVTTGLRWWQAALLGVGTFVLLQSALVLSERMGWTHLFPIPAQASEPEGPPARTTLQGNGGPIWSTAFSPDGKTLAMGIDDGTVKLWDLTSGRVARTLNAHPGPVWSLAWSPDGTRLVTASDDGTAKIWDTVSEKELKVLEHTTAVRAAAFSSDNTTLATGSRNGSIRLWNTVTGEEIGHCKGHRGTVVSITFAPDGKTLASSGGDKTIKLWDVATAQEQQTLQGHTGAVYAVAFSPDGKMLASGGSWDRTVRLWDSATGNPLATLTGHTGDVWSVAFSPAPRSKSDSSPHWVLASVSEDHSVRLWDVASHDPQAGPPIATFKGHTGTLYTVTFSRDGRTVASGGRDGTVKLWDVPAP